MHLLPSLTFIIMAGTWRCWEEGYYDRTIMIFREGVTSVWGEAEWGDNVCLAVSWPWFRYAPPWKFQNEVPLPCQRIQSNHNGSSKVDGRNNIICTLAKACLIWLTYLFGTSSTRFILGCNLKALKADLKSWIEVFANVDKKKNYSNWGEGSWWFGRRVWRGKHRKINASKDFERITLFDVMSWRQKVRALWFKRVTSGQSCKFVRFFSLQRDVVG